MGGINIPKEFQEGVIDIAKEFQEEVINTVAKITKPQGTARSSRAEHSEAYRRTKTNKDLDEVEKGAQKAFQRRSNTTLNQASIDRQEASPIAAPPQVQPLINRSNRRQAVAGSVTVGERSDPKDTKLNDAANSEVTESNNTGNPNSSSPKGIDSKNKGGTPEAAESNNGTDPKISSSKDIEPNSPGGALEGTEPTNCSNPKGSNPEGMEPKIQGGAPKGTELNNSGNPEGIEPHDEGGASEATRLDSEAGNSGDTEQSIEANKLTAKLEESSNILGLPKTIADACLGELCYNIPGPKGMYFPVINLVELQRLNIYALRKKLANKAIDIIEEESLSDEHASNIKGPMSDYCNALRDFDYMQQKVNHDIKRDPFYLMYSRWCDWEIMRPMVEGLYEPDDERLLRIPRDHENPEMIGDARGWTRAQTRRASLIKRFWFGIVGGLSLIAPMLLILLHHDRVTALATASVATVLFATTMAFYNGADASPLALVGATAAYAAVLIVLVGTKL
ncbi:hypothetical protein V490_03316 [Pseudogymnoascus sp. VKM F-3557]|nr:hypothetical protein V490_03316 [Pseudogymnoascus sp. VKM F-3557]